MKPTIQPVKGTRDFYPEEMAIRTWLYHLIGEVSRSFGYQEYESPILERIDLYAAKSGEELVKKQAFVFPDRGGDLISLRPELTPSLARMVAQKQNALIYPLRWWSFGPFWRYEAPQRGRTREFFQWNIDMLGVSSPEADAELIAVAAEFFKRAGLGSKEVQIHVNNRRLMDTLLAEMGIDEENKQQVFHVIDRKSKLSAEDWGSYALEAGLTPNQLKELISLLGNKDLWTRSDELIRLFSTLEALGVSDYVSYDPQIIRGILYYTGTVFEAVDANEKERALLGGGRYDNLVRDVGGDPLSGVGFAMGDVTMTLLLEKYNRIPAFAELPRPILVTVFDPESLNSAYRLASELRAKGLEVVCYPEPAKLQKQLKFADRRGINLVILQGPDEVAVGKISIKNMKTHSQETLTVQEAAAYLKANSI